MKKYIPLCCLLLWVGLLACTNKSTKIESADIVIPEVMDNENTRNDLFLIFDTLILKFRQYEPEGTKNYYMILKETDTNDTIFEFSYFRGKFHADPKEMLNYKGFVKTDSAYIAIFDGQNIGEKWYRDSIFTQPFPDTKNPIPPLEPGQKYRMHIITHGYIKNNKYEPLGAVEMAEKKWFYYFKSD